MAQVAAPARGPWRTRDAVTAGAFLAGPFVVPVLAPLAGAVLVRRSPAWDAPTRRLAAWCGVVPALAAVAWLLWVAIAPPGIWPAYWALVAVAATDVLLPPAAGLILLRRRR